MKENALIFYRERKALAFLVFIPLMLSLYSCMVPGMVSIAPINTPPTPSRSALLQQSAFDDNPTPTPFQPVPPTPTYIPTPYPTGQITPTPFNPVATEIIEITYPIRPIVISEDQVLILLLGSDQRPYEGGFRTDTIMLISLNPKEGTASMVSFPRDLYLPIPGWTDQRINTVMAYGGFPLLARTIEYHFGFRPDYYVMINFWAFTQTIDTIGGIDVNVSRSLSDKREGYGFYTVPSGIVHMTGDTALWFSRSRKTSSDFDRSRRQREVIVAIFKKFLSLDAISQAPEIYDLYIQNVTSDMTINAVLPLLPLAKLLGDSDKFSSYAIGPAEVYNWTTPGGAQVLLPNFNAIQAVLYRALSNP